MRWRQLDVPRLEELIGAGVYYGAAGSEARAMRGSTVFVVGGGNSAGQAAVNLARHAARVFLIVRGGTLADSMSDYLVNEISLAPNIEVRFNRVVTDCEGDDRLERVTTTDRLSGAVTTEPVDGLFVLIGGEPRTDWLPPKVVRDQWGFVLTGHDLSDADWAMDRAPLPFETSVPGVFAVGDMRHGSMKRVASAVGEGASVIHSCHRYLDDWPT
jgi:thioredoxin reductase (NADPH)